MSHRTVRTRAAAPRRAWVPNCRAIEQRSHPGRTSKAVTAARRPVQGRQRCPAQAAQRAHHRAGPRSRRPGSRSGPTRRAKNASTVSSPSHPRLMPARPCCGWARGLGRRIEKRRARLSSFSGPCVNSWLESSPATGPGAQGGRRDFRKSPFCRGGCARFMSRSAPDEDSPQTPAPANEQAADYRTV